MSRHQRPTAARIEFQALLSLTGESDDDRDLQAISEVALEILRAEAGELALGPVACIDLDRRAVEVEMTIEATSAAELHQKLSLVLSVLERGTPSLRVERSSTSRCAAHAGSAALIHA